jgi:hypothetical protein
VWIRCRPRRSDLPDVMAIAVVAASATIVLLLLAGYM